MRPLPLSCTSTPEPSPTAAAIDHTAKFTLTVGRVRPGPGSATSTSSSRRPAVEKKPAGTDQRVAPPYWTAIAASSAANPGKAASSAAFDVSW